MQTDIMGEADFAWKRALVETNVRILRDTLSEATGVPKARINEVLGKVFALGYVEARRLQARRTLEPFLLDEKGEPVSPEQLIKAFERVWGPGVFKS